MGDPGASFGQEFNREIQAIALPPRERWLPRTREGQGKRLDLGGLVLIASGVALAVVVFGLFRTEALAPASAPTPAPTIYSYEQSAWATVRAALPSDTVILRPGSLPSFVERDALTRVAALETPTGRASGETYPYYQVTYSDPRWGMLMVGLNLAMVEPTPPSATQRAVGVRGVSGTMATAPGTPGLGRLFDWDLELRWIENGHEYSLRTRGLAEQHLLDIAESLVVFR